ncbi:MAG: YifB family Mg chelatase-like AAA ATPase [Woeseiaceae bacterium]
MGYARLFSRSSQGLDAPLVTVEVHLAGGLPQFQIVGLPETAVRESRERVRGAVVNSGFDFPASRITVNLAPADLPKHGGRFDVAIALGILAASGQIKSDRLASFESYAELTLSGEIASVSGALPACLATLHAKREALVSPPNACEASLVNGLTVRAPASLIEAAAFVDAGTDLAPYVDTKIDTSLRQPYSDISEIRGQSSAKRALEIAAAGGHNLLMVGPPGTGKSMLAATLPGLLPPMTDEEALDCACIRSLTGQPAASALRRERPFRSPHHSASAAALIGGGSRPQPGEISLAHNGVLFLDELPEFSRHALEMLREPLETGVIHLSRAAMRVSYPAAFQLIASMNPCACGYAGDQEHVCRCSAEQVRRYRDRISGPLLDRIDLCVTVQRVPFSILNAPPETPNSHTSAALIDDARNHALRRQGQANANIAPHQLSDVLRAEPDAMQLLEVSAKQMVLSNRSCHRIMRVARTIADLGSCDAVNRAHMAEAISLRQDRFGQVSPP